MVEERRVVPSAELAALIRAADVSACAATVVGYGTMGVQYVKALQALGVARIRISSRFATPLAPLTGQPGVEVASGGIAQLPWRARGEELAIVATPTELLIEAAERLAELGFRRLLIEKPVSLWSEEIERLAESLERRGIDAVCAYNRLSYPSFHEARARAKEEGGVTSCTYSFTELIKPDWETRFPAQELARWGIANSLHVVSMAHGLIGLPATWHGHRGGALRWHPAGSVFVGSGISEQGIPFSYHADWGSTGRWSVELQTAASSYRLCPLERLFRRSSALGDWQEVSVAACAVDVKAGITEQVAAMLSAEVRQAVPLASLREAAALTRFGEAICSYEARMPAR